MTESFVRRLAAAALAVTVLAACGPRASDAPAQPPAHEHRQISHYTCPMHPAVRESRPGKCPICGMDLVPVEAAPGGSGTVRVEPERLQKLGVRFATAERAPLVRTFRALGRVTWDEGKLVDVVPKVRGYARELRADAVTGARVTKGDVLFSLYGPELLTAQAEFLRALVGGDESLRAASRARLRLWDVGDREIAAIERRGQPLEALPVRAPASGVIVEKNVVEGGGFEAGERLFRIAETERVWIEAEIQPADLAFVTPGQPAEIRASHLPGGSVAARIASVLPALSAESRVARARIEVDNPDLALRPGMWIDVELRADLGERLVVPVSAVIAAGERSVVFVERSPGELEPRTVVTGAAGGEMVEVIEGLAPGDRVVAAGNFGIAAESRIQSGEEAW